MAAPDEGGVDGLVWMPPGSGPGKPLLGVADGGVDPSVEHHLHPSVGLVREFPGDFVLTKATFAREVREIYDEWKISGPMATIKKSFLFLFHLELLFSGIKIDTSVIPSRPNCVVDTEEHNHVLSDVKRLLC